MNVTAEAPLVVNGRRALSIAWKAVLILAPTLILAMALGLRLYGIDWDQGGLFHPDERAILMHVEDISPPPANELGLLLNADESPWNPRWFPYGSLPLYLLKGAQLIYEPISKLDIFDIRIPGRVISALADSLTVLMVFILGSRLYGRRVGILASALVALAVIHIQLSHFYAVDTLLTLFVFLSIFFIIRVAQKGRLRDSALVGVFLGMGLATKVSLAPLILIYLAALGMYVFSREKDRMSLAWPSRPKVNSALAGAALGGVVSLAVFFIAQPYAFLEWPIVTFADDGIDGIVQGIKGILTFTGDGIDGNKFVRDVAEQSAMVQRVVDYPYTRQYIDTTPYWYHIRQLAVWGLGLPLGIVAWLGLISAVLYSLIRQRKGDLLILSWVLLYFLISGAFDVKFMRYMLPITPFLILMGSRMVFGIGDALTGWRPRLTPWLNGGLALLVGATAFYALSYVTIYSRPHTAVQASQWIRDNVSEGTIILKEHWEEGLPNLYGYRVRDLPMYEGDTPVKMRGVSQELSQAEYVVFFSNRLYGTIPRLPERYPLSSQYYRLLFSEKLGYELVHYETSYPSLFGVTFVDDTFNRPGVPPPSQLASLRPSALSVNMGFADESFTVYDHPKTLIFRNVDHLSAERLQNLLETTGGSEDRILGLVYSDADARVQQEGGTWSQIVQLGSWTNRFPVVTWLLLIEVMALLVLPLTFLIFRPLPDRGFLFSKILGLLLTSYLVWMLSSLRWMAFSRSSITVALLFLFLTSLISMAARRRELVTFLRERWRLLVIGEVVFLVAFFAFFVLRLANPDLWHPFRGGEKPMDFAYLNAVLKSTYMPPYDPWFAGGFLNYYYMGQFMVATLIKASGIEPVVAYNLAVPLFFALTIGGVFALVYNLAEGTRRRLGGTGFSWSPVLAGGGAGLFVGVLGNLDGAVQVGQGAWRALIQSRPFGVFDFWRSSRLMPPDPPGHEITEFPFFTFLFADLHAHLYAIPITILVLGIGAALVLRRRRSQESDRTVWEEVSQLAIISLAVGSLRAINTWDFPTYMIIAAAAVALGEYLRNGGLSLAMMGKAAVKVGVVYGVGYILFLPFHANYETFYSGLEYTTNRTAFWQFMGVNGLFIFIVISFLLYEARHWLASIFRKGPTQPAQPDETGGSLLHRQVTFSRTLRIGQIAFLLLIVAALMYGVFALVRAFIGLTGSLSEPPAPLPYDTIVVTGILIVLTALLGMKWLMGWGPEAAYKAFAAILLGVVLTLAFGVDIFRVEGDIDRMNTVFKFYLQIWILLAIVSAYFLWRLNYKRSWFSPRWRLGKGLWLGLLAVLIISASIYPIMGTQVRLRDRFQVQPLTLNGAAFMKEATYTDQEGAMDLPSDYDAIRWLQNNVEDSPVILEGRTPLYRWGSRVSIYTGLPTVVGWDWHQTQQRLDYRWAIDQRMADVNRIYSTVSINDALNLMQKYGVEYVYVGELERIYYPEAGIAKFEEMEGAHLERVYQNTKVAIYRLKP